MNTSDFNILVFLAGQVHNRLHGPGISSEDFLTKPITVITYATKSMWSSPKSHVFASRMAVRVSSGLTCKHLNHCPGSIEFKVQWLHGFISSSDCAKITAASVKLVIGLDIANRCSAVTQAYTVLSNIRSLQVLKRDGVRMQSILFFSELAYYRPSSFPSVSLQKTFWLLSSLFCPSYQWTSSPFHPFRYEIVEHSVVLYFSNFQ